MVDIRLPNINASNQTEQMAQMKSYLYQLVEQLNWALASVESSDSVSNQTIVKADGSALPEATPQDTFNSIKALIIKSAEIVNAYTEEMSKTYNGVYVAQSDFGNYSEQVQNTISENANRVEQNYYKKAEIDSKVDDINDSIQVTQGFMKTGFLDIYEDGEELFGLAIGEKVTTNDAETFNAFASFTSNKLSFYGGSVDSTGNPIPVAYISNQRLYISDARILGDLYLGKYVIETSHGLTFRWVGGVS